MGARVLAIVLCAILSAGCASADGGGPDTLEESRAAGASDSSDVYFPTEEEKLAEGVELVRSSSTGEFDVAVMESLGEEPIFTVEGTYDLAAGAYQTSTTIAANDGTEELAYASRTVDGTSYVRITGPDGGLSDCWIRGADLPRPMAVGVFGIRHVAIVGKAYAYNFREDAIRVGFPTSLAVDLFPSKTKVAMPGLPRGSEVMGYLWVSDEDVRYTLVGGEVANSYARAMGEAAPADYYRSLALEVSIRPTTGIEEITAPEASSVTSLQQAQAGRCPPSAES